MADCVHLWDIDDQDMGVCRKCGARRDFAKALREAGWPHRIYGYPKPKRRKSKDKRGGDAI